MRDFSEEIGVTDAGVWASPAARVCAKDRPPALKHPAALPGQAIDGPHESATETAPAEQPCTAGSDGAEIGTHESASDRAPRRKKSRPQDGGELVHSIGGSDAHPHPDQFANPLVGEIVELWRQRQIMVEAQRKLTLQAHAICRRFTAGDKAEAQKLYAAITKGKEHHLSDAAAVAVAAIMAAQEPLVAQRNAFERTLSKLGRQLPIAHMADRIRGVSHGTLATIVGELGDLSAYEKGIAGIWKRAGLAVIDGERQRMKSGDAALIHGYSPMRRSVFWNIGGALMKAQSTGEGEMPYRAIYDARKALELARGIPKAHAHNRASRHMTKALLRDLWREWCRVSKAEV